MPGSPRAPGDPGGNHQSGGNLLLNALHPSITIFETVRRALPDGGWMAPSVSQNNPVQFDIARFNVPVGQALWIYDYEFTPYRQSGIDPGDSTPCEDGRFSGSMGFDLTVSSVRPGRLNITLDPVNVTSLTPIVLPATPPPGGNFDPNSFQSFPVGSVSGEGSSLLPVTSELQGARQGPFALIAKENADVRLRCVIFNRILTPLAFIQARLAGFLIHTQASDILLERIKPQ